MKKENIQNSRTICHAQYTACKSLFVLLQVFGQIKFAPMLFNSIEFLVFLPLVFLLYWRLKDSLTMQNLFVVAVSYLFYGWWDYRFLFLISFTTLCSFLSGVMIDNFSGKRSRKVVAGANIVLNLGILGIFKYYNFFADSFAELLSLFGMQASFTTLHIVLPVGISFYTFQALSYTIDVYRGDIKATRNATAFFAYISFFPQLVAGPIERSTNLLPQFLSKRHFRYDMATDGLRQMLWGFFKKVVVADNCAAGVNNIFIEAGNLDSISLIYGALLFTVQIYGDFSGYSDIAIGTARLFGINLMRNFNFPYFSRDIAEFWRKWHISLTTWFRDYIYIPLGGSRCGKLKSIRNTIVIFLTSGLWHGANWTFVLWGVYHAILFIPLLVTGNNRKHLSAVAAGKMLPSPREALQMCVTFFLVMIGWVMFRAESISAAAGYYARMFTCFKPVMPQYGKSALVWIVVMFLAEWMQRDRQHAMQIEGRVKNRIIRYAIYYAIVVVTVMFQGETAQFIYFQF